MGLFPMAFLLTDMQLSYIILFMIMHNNLYKYRGLASLKDDDDFKEFDYEAQKQYWKEIEAEPRFADYFKAAQHLHDADILSVGRIGDTLEFYFSYWDDDKYAVDFMTLQFNGVKDYRSYKTNNKGQMNRKVLKPRQYHFDDIVIEDGLIRLVFTAWTNGYWKRAGAFIIWCDEIKLENNHGS